jgi:hypothetical protein
MRQTGSGGASLRFRKLATTSRTTQAGSMTKPASDNHFELPLLIYGQISNLSRNVFLLAE